MKRLFSILVGLAFIGLLAGCPAMPPAPQSNVSSAQQVLNATAATCKSITATITTADQAVLSGALKGNDARNAVKGLAAAQAGCVAALASVQAAAAAPPPPAASGVPK